MPCTCRGARRPAVSICGGSKQHAVCSLQHASAADTVPTANPTAAGASRHRTAAPPAAAAATAAVGRGGAANDFNLAHEECELARHPTGRAAGHVEGPQVVRDHRGGLAQSERRARPARPPHAGRRGRPPHVGMLPNAYKSTGGRGRQLRRRARQSGPGGRGRGPSGPLAPAAAAQSTRATRTRPPAGAGHPAGRVGLAQRWCWRPAVALALWPPSPHAGVLGGEFVVLGSPR